VDYTLDLDAWETKKVLPLTGIELRFLGCLARNLTLPRHLEERGDDVI
jgi:hypothetical protein